MVVRVWWSDLVDLPYVARNIEVCLKEGWARIVRATNSFIELTATQEFGAEDKYLHECIYDSDFLAE